MTNKPPVVGIAGTHSTGKTTLVRAIENALQAEGLVVGRTSGLARRAARLGFPRMLDWTVSSTARIIIGDARDAMGAGLEADVVLADGTPYDALAYLYAGMDRRAEHLSFVDADLVTVLADLYTRDHALVLAAVLDPGLPLSERPRQDPDYGDLLLRAAIDRHLHGLLAAGIAAERLRTVAFDQHDAAVKAAVAAVHRHRTASG